MARWKQAWLGAGCSRGRRWAFLLIALALGTGIWLPTFRLFYGPRGAGDALAVTRGRVADGLAAYQGSIWASETRRGLEVRALRQMNPEWDIMARAYFVLAMANRGLADPSRRDRCIALVEPVIREARALRPYIVP